MPNPQKYKNLKKMPWISKQGIKQLSKYDPQFKWDDELIDLTFTMAIDELGFNPNMVNRGNILKAILKETPTYLRGEENPLLEKIASDLWKIYDENDTSNVNLDTLKSNIQKVDEEYNIYNDEGLSIINELLDRELLKPENIRNLYNEKYIDKYGKSKP